MSGSAYTPLVPGVGTVVTAYCKALFVSRTEQFLAQGRYIAGDASRDAANTVDVTVLEPGKVMGKISTVVNSLGTVNFYAPSIIGKNTVAITATATTITTSAAVCTEIARRCGATGTIKVTGPPVASGVVRTLTATYSAVGSTTITITALGVNDVQTLNFANSPSGSFTLNITDANGVEQMVGPIVYSGTAATLVSHLQTATDAALVANAIVWSGSAVTAIVATFSGTGYANLPQPLIFADIGAMTAGTISVTHTTVGVDGRFVIGSFLQPTDGSNAPLTLVSDWDSGIKVTDSNGLSVTQVDFQKVAIGGAIDTTQIIDVPVDPSLLTWLQQQLSTASGGKFSFAGTTGVY